MGHGPFQSYSDNQELKKKRGNENTYMKDMEKQTYVTMFEDQESNMTLPFSYVKHMNFLNFEEFNKTNPIYVNIVRHPVERVISWYYYVRQNWYQLDYNKVKNETTIKKGAFVPSQFKITYEECFLTKSRECIYPIGGSVHHPGYGGSHYSQVCTKFITLGIFRL